MELPKLTVAALAKMMDVSAVQANSTKMQVLEYANLAMEYGCEAVFALSCFLPLLRDYRHGQGGKFNIGGTVGFPSGQTTTQMKAAEAKLVVDMGADEIDMMLNVGYILSGMYQEALDDIRAVKDAVGGKPLKVIIECHYLTDDLMRRVAEMVVEGGAQWVKTGTGWAPTGATLENVTLLKQVVGDRAKVKAAGGVRDLETIRKMVAVGVERFGVGGTARKLLEEANEK